MSRIAFTIYNPDGYIGMCSVIDADKDMTEGQFCDLYQDYVSWAYESDLTPLDPTNFTKKLVFPENRCLDLIGRASKLGRRRQI